jgi:protein kinase A
MTAQSYKKSSDKVSTIATPQVPEKQKKLFGLNDITVIKDLGKGSFGKVKLIRHNRTNQYYAMKCLEKENIRGKKQIQHIQNEKSILKQFKKGDFCCSMYESLQDEHNLYIILEFLPGEELYKQIKKKMYINEEDSRFYLAEIILGVEKLHQMGIIYRDLKPENILIDRDGHIKLIDFGFAKQINNIQNDRSYTNCGTPGYCAPEVMLDSGHNYKADIWSIGILICEVMGGFTPFQSKHEASNPKLIMEKCRNGKLNLPKNLNGNQRDLVKTLLHEDPNQRPEIFQIKEHSFFREIDWN